MVTTKGGAVFSCIPHATSGCLAPLQWRWLIIDARGGQYIGPAINDDPALGSLADRVSEWWEAYNELAAVASALPPLQN